MASPSTTSVSSAPFTTDHYDDFYITCNPPLSQDGVTFVLDDVKSHFGNVRDSSLLQDLLPFSRNQNSTVGTIVYESDVPWIRYSTKTSDQPVVTEYIKDLLVRILEEDLHRFEDSDSEDDEPGRIYRVMRADGPGTDWIIDEPDDAHRYPEGINLPYRDVWRGTEDLDGLTVEGFLKRCAGMLGLDAEHAFKPWEEVELIGNCRATQAVLAASDSEKIALVKARLDHLLSFYKLMTSESLAGNLIYFEGGKNCQFHFRQMAKLGLNKTTLVPPLQQEPNPEAQRTIGGAVLRTLQLHGQDKWIADLTRYDIVDISKLPKKALTVFGKVDSFSSKSRGPVRRPVGIGGDSADLDPAGDVDNYLTPTKYSSKDLTLSPTHSRNHTSEDTLVTSLRKLIDVDLLGDVEETLRPGARSHILDEQNPPGLPEAMEPVKGESQSVPEEDLLVFDCASERPKQLHRTMDQKAGRSPLANRSVADAQASFFQKLIEAHLKKGVDVLRYAPGRVELKMEFGRLYHVGLQASLVSDGSVGSESWGLPETLSMLEREDRTMRFSPVLSSREVDANTLAGLGPLAGKWTLTGVETFFDIFCFLDSLKESTVIELNAKDFSYEYRNEHSIQLSQLFIHCPQRAWDLVASAKTFGTTTRQTQSDIGGMIEGLEISVKEQGEVMLLGLNERDGIRDIQIRRVASYSHDDSILEISLTSLTAMDTNSKTGQRVFKGGVVPLPGPVACEGGNPQQWIQASISSKHANELLARNLAMEIGEDTTYDGDLFQREGIFESLYKPALGMITRMDKIGITNNNNMSVCHKENSRGRDAGSVEGSVTSGRPYE